MFVIHGGGSMIEYETCLLYDLDLEPNDLPMTDTDLTTMDSLSRNMTPRSMASHTSSNVMSTNKLRESLLGVRYVPSSSTGRSISQDQWIQTEVELRDTLLSFKLAEKPIQLGLSHTTLAAGIEKDRSFVLHLRQRDTREECFLQFSDFSDLEGWAHDILNCILRSAVKPIEQMSAFERHEKSKRSFTGSSLLSSMKHVIRKSVSKFRYFPFHPVCGSC
jgi:hypothetical protein